MVKPRRVAVALVVSASAFSSPPSFLVVASRKHADKWVLPKGGIEEGEYAAEAAEREAWEEAGLILGSAMHLDHLTELPDSAPHKKSPSTDSNSPDFVPSTTYSFEPFSVGDAAKVLAPEWPEQSERTRKWVVGWDELVETSHVDSFVAGGQSHNEHAAAYAFDEDDAEKLWKLSNELVGRVVLEDDMTLHCTTIPLLH